MQRYPGHQKKFAKKWNQLIGYMEKGLGCQFKKNNLFPSFGPSQSKYAGSRSVEVIMHAKAEIFDFAVEELPVGGVAVIVFQENLKFSAHYVGIFKLETRPG